MEKYLDCKNNIDEEKLKQIANEMKNGKIAIFPTETVYGIGTNGLDAKAVKRIYEIKNRSLNNPINLLVSSIEMVKMITENISDLEYKLMEAFFPGPFTLILNKKSIIPNIVTANGNNVGVRMPNHEIAKKLIEYANVPLATPSANISGKPSLTSLEEISDTLSSKVDFIIDGGKCDFGLESTIVQVIEGIPHVLRPGAITKEQIEKICGSVIVDNSNLPSKQLKHYQLDVKSILVYSLDENKMIDKIIEISRQYHNPIVLTYLEHKNNYKNINIINIGSMKNLLSVSKNLFENIKKAESLNPDVILIEGIEEIDLGLAIMNRFRQICNNNYIEI